MEDFTLPQRIKAATFLKDLPWLIELKKECRDKKIDVL